MFKKFSAKQYLHFFKNVIVQKNKNKFLSMNILKWLEEVTQFSNAVQHKHNNKKLHIKLNLPPINTIQM